MSGSERKTERLLNGLAPKGTKSVATTLFIQIYIEGIFSVYYHLFSGFHFASDGGQNKLHVPKIKKRCNQ